MNIIIYGIEVKHKPMSGDTEQNKDNFIATVHGDMTVGKPYEFEGTLFECFQQIADANGIQWDERLD